MEGQIDVVTKTVLKTAELERALGVRLSLLPPD